MDAIMTQTTEEQPRYEIDQGNHKEKKILSEEQAKALHKMLKANTAILSDEERDLIYKLQDKLDQETARVKSLQNVKIGSKKLDDLYTESVDKKKQQKAEQGEGEVAEDELEPLPTYKHTIGFKPDEVVQRYIECWNQQKFGAEYDCFDPNFLKTDRETYKDARQRFYQSQLSLGGMKINFDGIESSDIREEKADVTAEKSVVIGNQKPRREKDTYELELVGGRWVISGVKPVGR